MRAFTHACELVAFTLIAFRVKRQSIIFIVVNSLNILV